ncbi:uncharacterized protein LOC116294296 [Actinia tenebrosa]|uniref:Uncharacterized protein LOC116294296 n=1 Tax=Actinia tenebrosa TaxID=6105 RepID=A0A6P8HRI6_ACTTE|nr:uncharacterized protein LOC116294296 [Actinia tenebrosa]
MADKHWDEDYFIEVSSSKIPEESTKIRGIGRGKMNITQDISSLKLPKAAVVKEKEYKSTASQGRGRGELRSFMSHGPARLPKDKNTRKDLIGLHSISHFPSLQSVASSSKQSPSSSPKNSAKNRKSTSQTTSSSTLSYTDTDSNWPSLKSLPEPSNKMTEDLHSFAQACKESGRDKNPTQSLSKDLRELLQLYGNVISCDIERDVQGNSLGCAIISMETKAECEWIISCFHDEEYPGCTGLGKLSCTFLS